MEPTKIQPDNTAIRTALWRAIHAEVDAQPPVFEDEIGLELAAPEVGWQKRPDIGSDFVKPFRASIVARARFIEDLVKGQAAQGLSQYVILGAGLDTFAQRNPQLISKMRVFEVDQPGPQAWKRQRLIKTGLGVPNGLSLVPVDFEAGQNWLDELVKAGFDAKKPAVIVSTGVSMYLTKEANANTLQQIVSLAPGSILAMTFLLPLELMDAEIRPGFERAQQGAAASGTPFISFFKPDELVGMAKKAGFEEVRHVSSGQLAELYFADRNDGLRPPNNAEEFLVATV